MFCRVFFLFHIFLAGPYWASEPPASKNSSQGQTVTFVCGAIGKPKPTYTFFKNGEGLFKLLFAPPV